METKELILGYSAIVSTLSFIWVVWDAKNKLTGKIKVEAPISLRFLEVSSLVPEVQTLPPAITPKVTNCGQNERFIERPYIQTLFSIMGSRKFYLLPVDAQRDKKFPLKLEPGKRISLEYDILSFNEQITKKIKWFKSFNKARVVVEDTLRKKYSSEWLSMKKLLDWEKEFQKYTAE